MISVTHLRACLLLATSVVHGRACAATREAVRRKLPSPTSGVPTLDAWLLATEADSRPDMGIGQILSMPTQAQRELSASVKALQTADFEADAKQDTSGDAIRRFRNWLAECDRQAGRWTQACPWQREGKGSLSNTVYRTVFARRYRLSRPVCAQGSDTCKCGKRHSADLFDRHDGDHDEADCESRNGLKTHAHNFLADALKQFLEECNFRNVRLEHKYWDKARVGEEKTRRVPDILATHPTTGREYVIDCRIFWNTMSDSSSGGYASYTSTGHGARKGEQDKRDSWKDAMMRRRAEGFDDVEFVPFSIEVGGVWGPAARRFFDGCLATANDARDVDFYHWSSQSFGEVWKDALSVLMARERARIGMAASEGDLSRRIVAYAYDEQEDSAADT